jgi:hypothetical protein
MNELEKAYHDAWLALPESVSGDAAPPGTSLADRIRAIVQERDYARNTAARCHEMHQAQKPKVCTKCGTTGCLDDANSGWYDDDTPVIR